MRHSYIFLLLLLVALPLELLASPSHPTRIYETGRWGSEVSLDYFYSDANFDSDGGAFESLGLGRYYKNYGLHVQSQYDFSESWALKGSMGLAMAESFDGTFSRTNSSLTEAGLGVAYSYYFHSFEFFPEAWLHFPFNRVDPNTDAVLTGEGALLVTPSLWLRWDLLPWLKPIGRLGWSYRDEERSSLLLYDLGIQAFLGRWSLRSMISGLMSVTDDGNTNTPQVRDSVTSRVSGSSFRYYSVNPNLLNLKLKADYALSPAFFAGLGAVYSLDGKNAAHGYSLVATLGWDINFTPQKRQQNVRQRQRQDARRFEVEAESYDEELFTEPIPPHVQEQRKREMERRQKRQQQLREQRRRLQRPSEPTGQDIDQMIDETERGLQ